MRLFPRDFRDTGRNGVAKATGTAGDTRLLTADLAHNVRSETLPRWSAANRMRR